MARNDAEDLRRRQLVAATLDTIAEVGFGATTLALIGQRAGVSAGLIAHYFGDKDGLLEAALRSLAARLSRATTARLRAARTPRERIQSVIEATLAPEEFEPRSCGVWLAFWGQVNHSARLRRIQAAYQRRTLSNLRHALGRMMPEAEARRLATALAAMIDGLWLRAALSVPNETDSAAARAIATAFIDDAIARVAEAPARSGGAAVDAAVAAARAALPAWAARPARARGDVLRAAAREIAAADAAAGEWLARLADLVGLVPDAAWPVPPGLVALRLADGASLLDACRAAAPLAHGHAVVVATDAAGAIPAGRVAAALAGAGLPPGLFGVVDAGDAAWETLRQRPEAALVIAACAAEPWTVAPEGEARR